MKLKLSLMAVALGALSAYGSPSELCSPTNVSVISGAVAASTTVSCAAIAADSGFVLTGITVTAQIAWQDSSIPPVATTSMMSLITPGGGASGVGAFTVTGTGPGSGVGIGSNSASASLASLVSLGAFTVNIGSPTVLPLGDIPSNATVTVKITTTEAPLVTPEPTTMLMFGSGLLMLGMVTRRKRGF